MKLTILALLLMLFLTVYIVYLLQGKNILEIIWNNATKFAPADPMISLAIYSLLFIVAVTFVFLLRGSSQYE